MTTEQSKPDRAEPIEAAADAPPAVEEVSAKALRDAAFQGVRWLTLTRGAAEAVTIASAVVLARLVPPSEFGHLAVAIIINELALAVANESIGAPIVQRRALEQAHIEGAAMIALAVGVALTLLTLFVIPLATAPLFGARTTELFRLFAPAFALAGVMIVPLAQLQRDLRFRSIAVIEIASVLSGSTVSVCLAFAGMGAESYVIGSLTGLAIMTVGYVASAPRVLPRWRPRHIRELMSFGVPASAAGLASVGYRNIDYLILGIRLAPLQVGYYYRAFTVGVEYERRLSGIVARIAFPVYARTHDAGHLRALRSRIVRVNATAVYPMLALFIALAPTLLPWLFGSRWTPSVLPAQILAVAGMASTIKSGTGPQVLAAGRPRALFTYALAELIAYGTIVFLVAPYGLTAVCVAVSIYQLLSLAVVYTFLLRPALDMPRGQLMRDVGPATVSCLPLLAIAVAVHQLLGATAPALVELLVAALLGGGAYIWTLRTIFPSAYADIALLARRILPGGNGAQAPGADATEDATAAAAPGTAQPPAGVAPSTTSPLWRNPPPEHRDGEPDLSIIVVTHNRTDLALTTLASARAAVGEISVEWLVVDSGSSDGTPDVIEHTWDDVRLLRSENVGFAAANNRALEVARGRYVLLLNPDAETIAGSYDDLLTFLDDHPDIGLASVVQQDPDGSLQYSIRRYPSPWLALGEALAGPRWTPLRSWREEEPRAERYSSVRSVDWLVGAFIVARTEAVRAVGPLDERFFLYSEEIDWCYRFRRAGWDVCHLPTMTITHHTGGSVRPDLLAQLSYAKVLFARKHYRRPRALAIQSALVLRHALRASAVSLTAARDHQQGKARAAAERHALSVLLGISEPPFGASAPDWQLDDPVPAVSAGR